MISGAHSPCPAEPQELKLLLQLHLAALQLRLRSEVKLSDSTSLPSSYRPSMFNLSSGDDLPSSILPCFLFGATSLPTGRGLDGAGDVLCLVADETAPWHSQRSPPPLLGHATCHRLTGVYRLFDGRQLSQRKA